MILNTRDSGGGRLFTFEGKVDGRGQIFTSTLVYTLTLHDDGGWKG